MKTVSTSLANAISNSNARYHCLVRAKGSELPDTINSLVYNDIINGSSDIGIGQTCSKSVTFSIKNPSTDLENEKIRVFEGISIDGKIEYIELGTFIVTTVKDNAGETKYTAYDIMATSFEDAYFSDLSYPNTDLNIINEICKKVGITFDKPSDFKSHTISSKPTSYTMREIIGYMACLQGKNATITSDNKLTFKWYTDTNYTLDGNRIYQDGITFSTSKNFKLARLTCTKRTNDKEETLNAGTQKGVGISFENPFMTQTILYEIFSKLQNFEFQPLESKFLGDYRVESGDLISVIKNGTTYKVPIMTIKHDNDGGLISTAKSIAKSDTSNSVNASGPTTKSYNRLDAQLLIVNQALVNKLDAETAKITYATIENLDATNAEVADLKASQITADYLKSNYAEIDLANIKNGSIKTAMIETGAIGTTQIADGSITDAKIVGLTANKITAGTLDAGAIDVINLNAANITVGTINGTQIADGSIDMSKLGSDVSEWQSTTTSNVSQALTDAGIVKTTIDNLKVGGENLIYNSKSMDNVWAVMTGASAGLSKTIEDSQLSSGEKQMIVNITTDEPGSTWNFDGVFNVALNKSIVNSNINRDFIFSFWIKSSVDIKNIDLLVCYGNGTNKIQTTSSNNTYKINSVGSNIWTRVQLPFQITSVLDENHILYIKNLPRTNGSFYYITRPQLEIGNIPSAYCESVKDFEQKVNSDIENIIKMANGKTTSYYSSSQPSGTDFTINDIWFDTDDGYKMYYWNGSSWVATQYGASAISVNAVTTEKISTSAITSGKIASGAIIADKIASNAVTADKILANAVTSDKILAGAINSTHIASHTITADKLLIGNSYGLIDLDVAIEGTLHTNFGTVEVGNGPHGVKFFSTNSNNNFLMFNNYKPFSDFSVNDVIYFSGTVPNFDSKKHSMNINLWAYDNNKKWVAGVSSPTITLNGSSWNKVETEFSLPQELFEKNPVYYIIGIDKRNEPYTVGLNQGAICRKKSTGQLIVDGTITGNKIVANAITADKIASKTITANEIASNTITASELNVTQLSAITADLGTVTAGKIQSANYVGGTRGCIWDLSTNTFTSQNLSWTATGKLTAKDVSLTGKITAESGKIGSFEIYSLPGSFSNIKYLSASRTEGDITAYVSITPSNSTPILSGRILSSEIQTKTSSGSTVSRNYSLYANGDVNTYGRSKYSGSQYPQLIGNGSVLQLSHLDSSDSGVVLQAGTFRLARDNSGSSGNSNHRWNTIYLVNSPSVTSDKNEKNSINVLPIEKVKPFIMGLNPSSYKYNSGTSDRYHYGLIAQDVEELMSDLEMDSKDFAGFIKSPKTETEEYTEQVEQEDGTMVQEVRIRENIIDGEYIYSLRYEEFIAPMIKLLQNHEQEISKLKNELYNANKTINELRKEVTNYDECTDSSDC